MHERKYEWPLHYEPPVNLSKDSLILDVGARDGDSAVWFFEQGFRNFRLVEPNATYYRKLNHNVSLLRKRGAAVELHLEPFNSNQLRSVAFAKFDCEGCEHEVNLMELGFPVVAEVHVKSGSKNDGVYDYTTNVGYVRYNF